MKIELELPEIKGYEYTGEYRYPKDDELFAKDGAVRVARFEITSEYPIMVATAPAYKTAHNMCGSYVEMKALEDALRMIGGTFEEYEYQALERLLEL